MFRIFLVSLLISLAGCASSNRNEPPPYEPEPTATDAREDIGGLVGCTILVIAKGECE